MELREHDVYIKGCIGEKSELPLNKRQKLEKHEPQLEGT